MKYKYKVASHDWEDDFYPRHTWGGDEVENLVKDAAHDYYYRHDGFECCCVDGTLDIEIIGNDESLGIFSVRRMIAVAFSVSKK